MIWFSRKKPHAPAIPAFQPEPVKVRAAEVKPKDEGIVVEEVDTSAMTSTGVHKAWNRLTGRQD